MQGTSAYSFFKTIDLLGWDAIHIATVVHFNQKIKLITKQIKLGTYRQSIIVPWELWYQNSIDVFVMAGNGAEPHIAHKI